MVSFRLYSTGSGGQTGERKRMHVSMLTLQPREALKLHCIPVDAFFYVLEGTGVVVGHEQEPVGPDMLIHSAAHIPQRLRNDGSGIFRFLVVKTARQKDPGRLL